MLSTALIDTANKHSERRDDEPMLFGTDVEDIPDEYLRGLLRWAVLDSRNRMDTMLQRHEQLRNMRWSTK